VAVGTLAAALFLGVMTGLLPASIISAFHPLKVIKGAVSRGRSGQLVRRSLVVVQFAASITLLMAIITVQRQMRHVANKDLGMDVDEVLHINVRGVDSVGENRDRLTNELMQHPAIQAISFQSRGYPVNGLSNGMVMVEKDDGSRVSSSLYHMWVDEVFAEVFGVEMIAGRFYSKDFPADSTRSVIVNESAVRSFGWSSPEDALGKEMGEGEDVRQVIGVVRDFHFEGLQKGVEPVRILPLHDQHPGSLAIRADLRNPIEVLTFLEASWKAVNPTVALDVTFMSDDVRQQYQAELMFRSLFMLFSPISLIIACLGLFGLASASTNQRVKEVGIRKVLGASRLSLLQLLSREFVLLVLVSLIFATPVAWWSMEHWLDNFQYRISFEWYFVVAAGGLTLLIALLTASSKALGVSNSNPSEVLRSE
ncbi:MAG: FtsX-like permease family protein, partial [Bacteroidota bacterium]